MRFLLHSKWHRKEANPSRDTIYGGKTFSCQGEHLTNSFYSRKSSGPFLSNLAQWRYDAYRMHYVYFSFSSKNSINSGASQFSFVIGNYSLAALRPKYLHMLLYFLHRQLKAGQQHLCIKEWGQHFEFKPLTPHMNFPHIFLPFFDLHVSNWKMTFWRKECYSLEKIPEQQQQKKKG